MYIMAWKTDEVIIKNQRHHGVKTRFPEMMVISILLRERKLDHQMDLLVVEF